MLQSAFCNSLCVVRILSSLCMGYHVVRLHDAGTTCRSWTRTADQREKVLLYYISLSLCIISNYYIAIMVCIFQVIWFVITWLENKETGIGAWIRFAIYSLLAGGTGAILIIPEAITPWSERLTEYFISGYNGMVF